MVSHAHVHRVGLKCLKGFEISHYSSAMGEKPDSLSANFIKIDGKSCNPVHVRVQAFQSNAVD